MTIHEYISDFLHDPYNDRWPVDRITHAISLAKDELEAIASAYIANRDIMRKKSILSKMQLVDKTIELQLENGRDMYSVLDENLVLIKSIVYNGCFIEHSTVSCSEEPCISDGKLIRGYASIGLPKGKFRVFPIPSDKLKVCDTECTAESSEPVVDSTCGAIETVIDNIALYGWGLVENIRPTTSEILIIPEDKEAETPEYIDFLLGKLEVNYQTKAIVGFPDNATDIIELLVNDTECIKNWVCGMLLRDDRDSHSRSLGVEELAFMDKRATLLLSKFNELYETDDLLALATQDVDNVSQALVLGNKTELDNISIDIAKRDLEKTKLQIAEDTSNLKERTCKNRFEQLDYRS